MNTRYKLLQTPVTFGILCTCLLLLPCLLPSQTLRGWVRDADNGQGLSGATVGIQSGTTGSEPIIQETNPDGEFIFENLRPGYYRCSVEITGYELVILQEVPIAAGNDAQLEIALHKSATSLPDITIKATPMGRRLQQELGEIPLTREQTLRFPAMSFDPARLAAAYPGVAQTDDGINGLSIRGNSPASVRWRLEGVEVVNPNHLPNAGTFSDGPAAASGGILMFSAQLLDNSRLLTGSYAPGYGDATGGIMDMYLRAGNDREHEFTAQAGLIGLDLAAEGPINSQKGSSYLANYRYSTVGLLSKMGISFGDETIDFQDFAFNCRFPTAKTGTFTVFGMGGLSENIYRHAEDSASIESFKELLDIDFLSKSGLAGLTHAIGLGNKTWIKTTLIASGQHNERDALAAYPGVTADAHSNNDEAMVSGGFTLSHQFNLSNRMLTGLQFSDRFYGGSASSLGNVYYLKTSVWLAFWQPWAAWEWQSRDERTRLQAGLHGIIAPFNSTSALDPRISLRRRLGEKHQISLSWGSNNSTQPMWLYAGVDSVLTPGGTREARFLNRNLDFTNMIQAALRYTIFMRPNLTAHAEFFWQDISDIPVDTPYLNSYSLLNDMEGIFSRRALLNGGIGRNIGAEIAVERRLQNGLFWMVNGSVFQSRYIGGDSIWRSTRWNLGHIANVVFGKEWSRQKNDQLFKSFGVNGRLVWTGGFFDQPVSETKNPFGGLPPAFEATPYSEQLPDYYRLDVRVYWKRHLGNRRNSTFAMEFQNITLKQNVAYYYWDPYTESTKTKYQLGLIPFISWRLEF